MTVAFQCGIVRPRCGPVTPAALSSCFAAWRVEVPVLRGGAELAPACGSPSTCPAMRERLVRLALAAATAWISALRSIAMLSAWRTRLSLNGGWSVRRKTCGAAGSVLPELRVRPRLLHLVALLRREPVGHVDLLGR